MNKYHYALLHGGKEPLLILGNFYGTDIRIPTPQEISLKKNEGEGQPAPCKYETYKLVGRLYHDIDVYELEDK